MCIQNYAPDMEPNHTFFEFLFEFINFTSHVEDTPVNWSSITAAEFGSEGFVLEELVAKLCQKEA